MKRATTTATPAEKRKKVDYDTSIRAPDGKHVDATYLSKKGEAVISAIDCGHDMHDAGIDQTKTGGWDLARSVAEQTKCKLTRLFLDASNSAETINMINAIQKFLGIDGILPINTGDHTDADTEALVVERIKREPHTARIAYIIMGGIMTSPSFCKWLIESFGVSSEKLDHFANKTDSEWVVFHAQYCTGIIPAHRELYTLCVNSWISHEPPRSS
jgi:hypothetical protein